ncbi:MAG: MaoC family dehydratase N-terminal domain-containing protein [Neisseriaceae bacterium]|nr:MaoC family dehydratase N-terminal domain-containing protein [Neisseriaceae bacterium]MBQ9725670.1 MaoC family dehydratase N-terminal domain-containing protein [Neisseriaceae bacterium]MBR1818851.1 MaoC family dehydratase N-terminal domain-containing protein [Neisseriaceae bacterium]
MTDTIHNFTFDELTIGQVATMTRTLNKEDIAVFAAASWDTNPAHLDEEYAKGTLFGGVIAHGMWSAGLISAAIGTQLPGVGTIYLGQDLQFRRPVKIGDTVTAQITVLEKDDSKKRVVLETLVLNQNGEKVVVGKATVLAPAQKIVRPAIAIPQVQIVGK